MASTKRDESFRIERDGALVRSVVPRRGQPYEHRCTKLAFEHIALRFDEGDDGHTIESLAEAEDVPTTQAATALAFLIERSIVETSGRRNYPATVDTHLDAMTEYHALREKGPTG